MAIHHMRINYDKDLLLEPACPASPFTLFDKWFQESVATSTPDQEPNGLCLSTVSKEGKPSSRIVLLKGYDPLGFVFYTNYESRKGLELQDNPFASMVFWWGQRSVRIEGKVEKISEQASQEYFQSRPRGSQLGAWTSPQSQFLPNRAALEELQGKIEAKFKDVEVIPKPPHWGGYRLVPNSIEFWQVILCYYFNHAQYIRYVK